MFKLRHGSFCTSADGQGCGMFSIWSWKSFFKGPINNIACKMSFCQEDLFPLIYWIVFILSILGLVSKHFKIVIQKLRSSFQLNSIWEFVKIYHGCDVLTTFRKRQYRILPSSFRRNTRLVMSVFSIKAWTLLVIGIIVVNPLFMSFWLTLNVFILGLDFFLWIMEILTNETELLFTTILSQTCFLSMILLVQCVRNVFQTAVEEHDTESLQLF